MSIDICRLALARSYVKYQYIIADLMKVAIKMESKTATNLKNNKTNVK